MNERVRFDKQKSIEPIKELFKEYGSISDGIMQMMCHFTSMSKKEVHSEVSSHLSNVSNAVQYLNKDAEICKKEEAAFIWISLGLTDTKKGLPLYIGFRLGDRGLEDNSKIRYFAYRIDTYEGLKRNLEENDNYTKKDTFLEDLYGMLLIKEDWDTEVLDAFIHICECKINNEDATYLVNDARTKICYNTGLINIYGNYIYIIATLDGNSKSLVLSKTHLKQEGFVKTEVEPIGFYTDRQELIFKATADDFDLDDIQRLKHIVTSRRERFPESAKDLTDDEICNRIKASLEFDLKMTARNPLWAAPFYNIKTKEIQYFLPLYLGSLTEDASLALVVAKGEHFYEVRTVLPLHSAYTNSRCVVSPSPVWLRRD